MRRAFLGLSLASLVLVIVAFGVVLGQACGGDGDAQQADDAPTQRSATNAPVLTPTAGPPTATPGTTGPTGTATGPAEHDGARALAIVKELAKEPRVSGTPAEARAAEYIAGLFRSYGYSTEIMEFEFDGDRFRAGQISVGGNTIEALTLAGSPGGKAVAAAVYVGLADDAGIGNKDLTGKMAVADRGVLNFVDKYANVKAKGAIGLVIVNNRPGPFSGNLTTAATIPVVAVSQEDGAAVLEAAKAGRSVGINAPPTVGLTKALNVIAKPRASSECRLVVGGHFDSVPAAPGANDNASGTANVIELARAAAVDGLDEGVCFATFGAEESGLYGSKAFVERMDKDGQLPRYMMNLDVTGIGRGVEVIGDSTLARTAIQLAKDLGLPAVASQLPANSGSDHESFVQAGVDIVFFTSGDFGTIHSPQDVSADIQEKVLDQVGDAALAVIRHVLLEFARG